MGYLLDTHILLWWLDSPEKIKKKAHEIISNRSNQIYISSISIWEMVIKKDIGKLKIPHNIMHIIDEEGFAVLPLTPEDALAVMDLPTLHSDPFDRALVSQAKIHNLNLITKDKNIIKYPINTTAA